MNVLYAWLTEDSLYLCLVVIDVFAIIVERKFMKQRESVLYAIMTLYIY